MNKEIIKNLNELLEIPQSTNGEINFYSIESNKFEAIITLIKKQLEDLENQLEEKDKVIDEIYDKINDLYYGNFFSNESPIKFSHTEIGKELLEILERGKNANNK